MANPINSEEAEGDKSKEQSEPDQGDLEQGPSNPKSYGRTRAEIGDPMRVIDIEEDGTASVVPVRFEGSFRRSYDDLAEKTASATRVILLELGGATDYKARRVLGQGDLLDQIMLCASISRVKPLEDVDIINILAPSKEVSRLELYRRTAAWRFHVQDLRRLVKDPKINDVSIFQINFADSQFGHRFQYEETPEGSRGRIYFRARGQSGKTSFSPHSFWETLISAHVDDVKNEGKGKALA